MSRFQRLTVPHVSARGVVASVSVTLDGKPKPREHGALLDHPRVAREDARTSAAAPYPSVWAAIGECRDPSIAPLAKVLRRPLAAGSESILRDMNSRCRELQALYLSIPITTGQEYLHLLAGEMPQDEVTRSTLQHEAIARNIARVPAVVACMKRAWPERPQIVPTELEDVPGWEQPDYHRLWVEVIFRFATAVVFAEGWQFSTGCTVEYVVTRLLGLPAYNGSVRPLTDVEGAQLLEEAAEVLSSARVSNQMTAAALTALTYLGHKASP